jgi:hypothetical protein
MLKPQEIAHVSLALLYLPLDDEDPGPADLDSRTG